MDDAAPPLELSLAPREQARTVEARVTEGTTLRARRILQAPQSGFAAFLDGVQRSRIIGYWNGLPLVHGTVAAVVRERRNRRMVTWRRDVEARYYLPVAFMPPLQGGDADSAIVDTTTPRPGADPPSPHPLDLVERAFNLVQRDRDRLEQRLGERWCAMQHEPLLIDGGIGGSPRIATSPCGIGVVKSHRVLYASDRDLPIVLGLQAGERTTAFRIESSYLAPVASWYLRLRDPAGHDPMWGLVRVEVAPRDEITEWADRVSSWILAEVAPLALPDARWDKMVYGVRDCEEFLRAISG